jgi:hypothetical protein
MMPLNPIQRRKQNAARRIFDFAVFRPSIATWFVLKSTGGTLIQQFGATGDRPVPNAYVP